jgi:hypothetical protein
MPAAEILRERLTKAVFFSLAHFSMTEDYEPVVYATPLLKKPCEDCA